MISFVPGYRFSDLPNVGKDHGLTLAQPVVVAVGIFDSHLHSSGALAGGIQCFRRGIRICRFLHSTGLSSRGSRAQRQTNA